jgi:hypothetical protein
VVECAGEAVGRVRRQQRYSNSIACMDANAVHLHASVGFDTAETFPAIMNEHGKSKGHFAEGFTYASPLLVNGMHVCTGIVLTLHVVGTSSTIT